MTLNVVAGESYYIKSAGYGRTTGAYQLTIVIGGTPTPTPPPSPDPTPDPTPEPIPNPAPPPTPGASIAVQSVQTASGLQLLVLGTNGNDTIVLSAIVGGISVFTGAATANYTGAFNSIVIYGFGGNDLLRVANSVMIGGSIIGGDGDDQLFDNAMGAFTLDGGAGDDLLVSVGGGADTLIGGAGIDSFWLDSTDTLSDAESAETAGKTVHRIAQFYQPYTSSTTDSRYVSMDIAGQNLTDPTAGYSYRNFAGTPLFVDGPQYNDIRQGYLGDCYYLASLAAMADTDPALVRQMIAPLGDGTFAVRFYRGGQEVYLRLDADLPANGGSLVYAGVGPDNELWVPLMEKAYAYFRYGQNSYSSIEGGWMATVNTELTGMGNQTMWTGGSASSFVSWMAGQLAAGHAVTLGSNSNASGPIVGGHAYMVKSVNGDGTVTVFNPWGVDGGSSTDANRYDGLVTLTAAQVTQYFMGAVACQA